MTNCPSQLTCSMYVDGALAAEAAAEVKRHVAECPSCAGLIAELTAESRLLRRVLASAQDTVAVPALPHAHSALGLLGFALGSLLAAWLATTVWQGVLGLVPRELDWINPLNLGGALDLLVRLILFLGQGGIAMIVTATYTVGAAVALALFALLAFTALKTRGGTAALLSVALAILALPSGGHALEIRRDASLVSVAAGETVDDTLVVFSESASIDGTVNGDLIVFTRSLTLTGTVTGNIVAFGQNVNVEGNVNGSVYGFGRSVDLAGGDVARNLFGFGSDVVVGTGSNVGANAAMFGNIVAVRGRVGKDVRSFSTELEISGEVVRNVDSYGRRVRVLDSGRIGGNLTSHVGDASNVQTASGATIGGATDIQVTEEQQERERSKYLSASFYIGQAIRLGAAFVAGLVLFWLFPALLTLTLHSGIQAVKHGAIGLITAIVVPIVSVIVCFTIIGIPLGIIGILLWILGLYFAKIVVALLIGRRLFAGQTGQLPHHAALLVAGLVLILIAVNIPYVGGLVNFLLTILGLGLLVSRPIDRYQGRFA